MLMIVAHPDDDGLFGGVFQKSFPALTWGIVCLTYTGEDFRSQELLAWQKTLGTRREHIRFLGFPDFPDDLTRNTSSFAVAEIKEALKRLDLESRFILTHGAQGEYGHPHHRDLHSAVMASFPNVLCFAHEAQNCDIEFEVPEFTADLMRYFSSQSSVIADMQQRFDCCHVGRYVSACQ